MGMILSDLIMNYQVDYDSSLNKLKHYYWLGIFVLNYLFDQDEYDTFGLKTKLSRWLWYFHICKTYTQLLDIE